MLRSLGSLLRLRLHGDRFITRIREGHVQPLDHRVRVVGPDPVRVLLLGGDYANGYNVRRREDALDGAVAALLSARLGRGVSVENRSSPDVPLDSLVASVGGSGAHAFDVVIWCPTFREAVRRPLARSWRGALDDLVRHLRGTSDSGIVLVAVPELLGHQPIAVLGRARAAAINGAIGAVAAAHDRVRAVAPPAVDQAAIEASDGAEAYRRVAEGLMPALLELLGAQDAEVVEPGLAVTPTG